MSQAESSSKQQLAQQAIYRNYQHKNSEIPYSIRSRLAALHRRPITEQLDNLLKQIFSSQPILTNEKNVTEKLIQGIELLHHLVNLNTEQRRELFGSEMGGVHYNCDLADSLENVVKAYQLNTVCPPSWQCFTQAIKGHNLKMFIYRGHRPSLALNQLIQGPTVIDCGMFSQLAMAFGARAILGDKAFDKLFGGQAYYLTQMTNYHYKASWPNSAFITRNLWYPFLRNQNCYKNNKQFTVELGYFNNLVDYQARHPGGNEAGHNSIIIKGKALLFEPCLGNEALSFQQVNQLLLESYNAPLTRHDKEVLPLLSSDRQRIASEQHTPAILENYPQKPSMQVPFDIARFTNWAKFQLTQRDISLYFCCEKQAKPVSEEQQQCNYLARLFCHDVINDFECCVILSSDNSTHISKACENVSNYLSTHHHEGIIQLDAATIVFAGSQNNLDFIASIISNNDGQIWMVNNLDVANLNHRLLFNNLYQSYCSNKIFALFINATRAISLHHSYDSKQTHLPPFPLYDLMQTDNTHQACFRYGRQIKQSSIATFNPHPFFDKHTGMLCDVSVEQMATLVN